MSQEQIERMAAMAGESGGGKAPKYLVPLIRFDGNRGEFRKISLDETGQKEENPLKKPVKLVILKKRRVLSSFSPTISYFTTEHNTPNDVIQLFSNTAGVVKHEMTGLTKEIREKYQSVKTHEVLYVLHDDEVCKFEVKGGSLGNYYDYSRKLGEEKLHGFMVQTVLSSEAAKNETGFKYFRVTFKNEDLKISLDDVEEKITEVDENLKKVDDYFARRQQQAKQIAKTFEDKPSAAEEVPGDIPF